MYVDDTLLCTSCGYNLRGLHVDQLCPECAQNVGRSFLADDVRRRSPQDLHRMEIGLRYCRWGIALAAVGLVLAPFPPRPGWLTPYQWDNLFILWWPVTYLLFVVGVFQTTVSKPELASQADATRGRFAVRATTLAAFATHLAGALPALGLRLPGVGWLEFTAGCLSTGMSWSLLHYLRKLARCASTSTLVHSTSLLMTIVPSAILSVLVFTIVGGMGGAQSGAVRLARFALCSVFQSSGYISPTRMTGGLGVCASGCVILVCAMWSLSILRDYGKVFREAAQCGIVLPEESV